MFAIHSSNGYTEIIKGIRIKTLCFGGSMLMTEFLLQKDALLPEHSHPKRTNRLFDKGEDSFVYR